MLAGKKGMLVGLFNEHSIAYLHDNVDAWDLMSDGTYARVRPAPPSPAHGAQAAFMAHGDGRDNSRSNLNMDLILWRHTAAVDWMLGSDDMQRELTRQGEKQAVHMAAWLDRQWPKGARIFVSPSRRTT